jgi:hypothetical protein
MTEQTSEKPNASPQSRVLLSPELEKAIGQSWPVKDAADLHGAILTAVVYNDIGVVKDGSAVLASTVIDYLQNLIAKLAPRDPLEQMLIAQMIWLHARIARLSVMAANETNLQKARVLNEAVDRACNTFRRSMQAFAEYRQPRRHRTFMPIRNASIGNIAGRQVVHGGSAFERLKNLSAGRRGTKRNGAQDAIEATTVPTIGDGTGSPQSSDSTDEAVGADAGAHHDAGETPVIAKRT